MVIRRGPSTVLLLSPRLIINSVISIISRSHRRFLCFISDLVLGLRASYYCVETSRCQGLLIRWDLGTRPWFAGSFNQNSLPVQSSVEIERLADTVVERGRRYARHLRPQRRAIHAVGHWNLRAAG